MSFRQRLERMGAAPRPAARAPGGEPASVSRAPSAARADAELAELRGRIREILERPSPPRRPGRAGPPPLGLSDLPFVPRRTPHGPLHRRLERIDASHRVGSLSVGLAARACALSVSRLALDPALAACDPRGWLFIDTETTGLAGAATLPFVVGMAGIDAGGGAWVEQLLLAQPADEPALLARVAERVQASTALVSFNGKSFDHPLLETRAVMNRMPAFEHRPHVDLLHVGRRLHRDRLGRCTLKRLESEVLGFDRGPDIDGSEVPARYHHFLRTGDARGLFEVVEHNFWDVLSMVVLVGLYGQASPALDARDLTGLARTLRRAGESEAAESAARASWEGGGGVEALRVLGELARSRRDDQGAVRCFEQLCAAEPDPDAHLALAKLYEHRLGDPARALSWVQRGTHEDEPADERRRRRLERKIRNKNAPNYPIDACGAIRQPRGASRSARNPSSSPRRARRTE